MANFRTFENQLKNYLIGKIKNPNAVKLKK